VKSRLDFVVVRTERAGIEKGHKIAITPITRSAPSAKIVVMSPKAGTAATNHQKLRKYSSLAMRANSVRVI
jgi:hypothetical protein